MKERIIEKIDNIKSELWSLNNYLYENPEIGLEEFKSSKAISTFLEGYGFTIENNFIDYDTAFKATYDSGKPGPTIAYLAEYDALPVIGHGCGHNLLGVVSVGSGIILKTFVEEIGGKVLVLGSPAEETFGVKVDMAKAGVFDNVDVAMIAHPSEENEMSGSSSELVPLRFTFKGKTSHAASEPEKGINALDACIQTFNNINALREHILDSSRIHGVISNGGEAANIVPDLAVADFYVRTPVLGYMETLQEKVINCAKAAALATGAKLEISFYEEIYKGMVTNKKLSSLYENNLIEVGVENIVPGKITYGSTDMGDVSQVCPSIHPSFAIVKHGEELIGHTIEFAKATITKEAKESMKKTIYAMVATGLDILENEALLIEIKKEFEETFKNI